ncbi:MAG: HAD family phosphatase [Paracoccaceae bacterium]
MERPKLVIFDCDGVLVDSEPITNQILRGSLAAYGLDLQISDMGRLFVGGTMAGVMSKARELGADLPDHWLDVIYSQIYAELQEQVEIVPGVEVLLDQLDAAGVGYAVGSNGPMRKMEITLGRTGLLSRLEGRIFSSHDCAAPKPAPDVYLNAAAHAGLATADCVVIEDSATGARAGRAAGMRCYGYCGETSPDILKPICNDVFHDMAELKSILRL